MNVVCKLFQFLFVKKALDKLTLSGHSISHELTFKKPTEKHVYWSLIAHTVSIVAFKQDANAVNVVNCSKIHFPPHCLIFWGTPYSVCSYTRCCVSVNCIASNVHVICLRRVWLGGNFVERYIILVGKIKSCLQIVNAKKSLSKWTLFVFEYNTFIPLLILKFFQYFTNKLIRLSFIQNYQTDWES